MKASPRMEIMARVPCDSWYTVEDILLFIGLPRTMPTRQKYLTTLARMIHSGRATSHIDEFGFVLYLIYEGHE